MGEGREAPPQEEKKVAEEAGKKEEAPSPAPPPPPREIVLKVFMHCEGCARKVRRCLRGFEGVEDVIAECRASKVVVKGEKADPVKVLERVQRKSHRKVELISPEPEVAKSDEKKQEPPAVITVLLRLYMHCDACAQEIKRRIQRMKGVESALPDLKGSRVTVKGVVEPQKLVDYVYKRTGKHAVVLKVEPEKEEAKEERKAEEAKEERKPEEAKKEEGAKVENKEGGGGAKRDDLELRKNELYYYHLQMYFVQEMNAYPPQIFSDENPNACSVM